MQQSEALEILKTGANVFLTGEPGSGKTHTINQYIKYLREYDIDTAVTASTGIAATHIGGMTIHAWSGIGVRKDLSEWDFDKIMQSERTVGRIMSARVLIIDEVSMLSAATLSMVEAVCRYVRRHRGDIPFGGLQVILVGDFFQLPPVSRGNDADMPQMQLGDSLKKKRVNPHAQFAFDSPAWQSLNPIVCYLSEQHRQEDDAFLEILSAIRTGDVNDKHRAHLKKRVRTQATPPIPPSQGGKSSRISSPPVKGDLGGFSITLFPKNADVDRINDAELEKLPGQAHRYTMKSKGAPTLIDGLKRGCLSPERLVLKVGAPVMCTRNDIEGQYVNGTLGEVVGFSAYEKFPMIETKDGRSITIEPVDWSVESDGKKLATITQLPLRLAWAITVHKSQGISLDAAIMDLSQSFEYGQGYVALSRVRTLAGLTLLGINERALETHPDVRTKDDLFRAQSDTARAVFTTLGEAKVHDMQSAFVAACRRRE